MTEKKFVPLDSNLFPPGRYVRAVVTTNSTGPATVHFETHHRPDFDDNPPTAEERPIKSRLARFIDWLLHAMED